MDASVRHWSRGDARQPTDHATARQPFSRRASVRVSPPGYPRALRVLPTRRWVTEDGPHPLGELGAVASRCELVVLTGRATHVP
jgi:hypothetical protein